MTETAQAAPAQAEQPVQAEIAAQAPRERGEGGKFAARPAPLSVSDSIRESHEFIKETARKALETETDRKALDGVKPKGQGEGAKSDPASKDASATAKAKPEPSSKEATRTIEPKKLEKARKALELEGWTEDDLADLADDKVLSLGTKYQEKHSKADRDKREAAEAAKKGAQTDPGKQTASATERDATDDADEAEYVKLAEEHFKGFEAETDEGTKAFRTAQARFARAGIEKATAKLTTQFEERLTTLEQGLRGEARLERALDRAAIDIPQLEDKDVRSKAIARVLSLVTGEDTAAEFDGDLPKAIREVAAAMKLKDEGEERRKAADDELRAAKAGGQPITGTHAPVQKAPESLDEVAAFAARDALRKARGSG